MAKMKSRTQRWQEAASAAANALGMLQDIQAEYQDWRDNLPENLECSAVAEKLDAVCELELSDALDMIQEAEALDLPLGFGRD